MRVRRPTPARCAARFRPRPTETAAPRDPAGATDSRNAASPAQATSSLVSIDPASSFLPAFPADSASPVPVCSTAARPRRLRDADLFGGRAASGRRASREAGRYPWRGFTPPSSIILCACPSQVWSPPPAGFPCRDRPFTAAQYQPYGFERPNTFLFLNACAQSKRMRSSTGAMGRKDLSIKCLRGIKMCRQIRFDTQPHCQSNA